MAKSDWLEDDSDFSDDEDEEQSDEEEQGQKSKKQPKGKEAKKQPQKPKKVDVDLNLTAFANATKHYDQMRFSSTKFQKTVDASKKVPFLSFSFFSFFSFFFFLFFLFLSFLSFSFFFFSSFSFVVRFGTLNITSLCLPPLGHDLSRKEDPERNSSGEGDSNHHQAPKTLLVRKVSVVRQLGELLGDRRT